VATPVAKRLNIDRKSSFLDKVVSREQEKKQKSLKSIKPSARVAKGMPSIHQ